MPTYSARLAWAAPIAVNHLGAHLQAFLNATPKISMLRLCNRFGKGKNVPVTRLPIELIDRIAEEIMHHHRLLQHTLWDVSYSCWLGECDPIDHIGPNDVKSLYYEINGKWKKIRTAQRKGDYLLEGLPDLTEDQVNEVNYFLQASTEDDLEGIKTSDANYYPLHAVLVDDWCERTGFAGRGCRGWIGHSRSDMIKYFGLEIWCSHTYRECGLPGCPHNNTITYLTLPVPSEHKPAVRWDPRSDEDGEEMLTETSFPMQVAFPSKPRKTLLAAFPRAMKILGLSIDDVTGNQAQIGALEEDLDQEEQKVVWVDKQGVEHSSEWPKLMLLSSHS